MAPNLVSPGIFKTSTEGFSEASIDVFDDFALFYEGFFEDFDFSQVGYSVNLYFTVFLGAPFAFDVAVSF